MKKIGLVRHLINNGCVLKRQGANHEVYIRNHNGKILTASVPRHNEIKKHTAIGICKMLDIQRSIH